MVERRFSTSSNAHRHFINHLQGDAIAVILVADGGEGRQVRATRQNGGPAQRASAPHPNKSIRPMVGLASTGVLNVNQRAMHIICLPDRFAAAMVRDDFKLRKLPLPHMLQDPVFMRLRALVELHGDPELDGDQRDGRGVIVNITTHDGTRVSMGFEAPKTAKPVLQRDLDGTRLQMAISRARVPRQCFVVTRAMSQCAGGHWNSAGRLASGPLSPSYP